MKFFLKKRSNLLILLIIVFLGITPRAIEVLSGNYLFGFDQGMFYEDVRQMVETRKPTLIGVEVGGIGGFFQGPGWTYFLLIPYLLFHGDPYGGMIFMLLLGAATIFLSYLLFYKTLGNKASLLAAFFIAISPGIISQSRFIWPPFVIPPLTILMVFFILKSLKNPTLYIPLAIGTIGLMSHFEIATGITLLVSTVITLLFLFPRNVLKIKVIGYSFLAFTLTQITLIIFDLRHNFISSRGIVNLLLHNKTIDTPYNFQNHIDIFKDSFLAVSFGMPLFVVTALVSTLGGIVLLRDKKVKIETKRILLFVFVNSVILFLVFLPMKMVLWPWWVLELPIFLCIIFGIVFSYLLQSKNGKIIVASLLTIYSGFFLISTFNWYKNDFNDYGGTAKIKGKIDAIDFIYKDAGSKDFGLLVFTPPVYTYAYDYLLQWYAEKKYGYVPPKEKKQKFYLLMESDSLKPTSHIGWQKTVVVDGEIEKEIKLPSGFIIQKRNITK